MTRFPTQLLDGYQTFVRGAFQRDQTHYRDLAFKGQSPDIMMICCCDSRVAPEVIFQCAAGDVFVVRNVANLVPPYQPDGGYHGTSAAIEYAVNQLQVSDIVVLGHGYCGGIKAALTPQGKPLSPGDFIGKWMGLLASAAEMIAANELMTPGERQQALERISIRNSIANLRGYPDVTAREKDGALHIHGAWFDIASGELWVMDDEAQDFRRLDNIHTRE